MTFGDARIAMAETFEKDPDFRNTYTANVACLLRDRYTGKYLNWERANSAADEIMDLVFNRDR